MTPSACEACAIAGPDGLRMLDPWPPARTPAASMQPLEDVEDERVGAVADRVDDGLDAVRVRVEMTLELSRSCISRPELPASSV